MAHLQLTLLGGFHVQVAGGSAVDVANRKTRALLAYLALPPGRRHSRLALVSLLWADRAEKQAQASLRQALVELNRVLERAVSAPLIKDRDTVALDPESVQVDAAMFEDLAAKTDIGELERAATLYAGDLLQGFDIRDPAYEEWLLFERQRFRGLAGAVLRRLSELQTGHKGVATAERLIALEPLQEEGYRTLMRLHAEAGELGLALRAYEVCRQVLKRELNVAPSCETEALHQEIRGSRYRKAAPERETSGAVLPRGESVGSKLSVAVLPFTNMNGDPAQQIMSDSIAQDIATELSRFRSLKIVARHSAFGEHFVDAAEAGRKLEVEYVVDGSVLRAGEQIRITARLTETDTASQLWAERYARDMGDLFVVQDEVARTIVGTLSGRLEDAGAKRARTKHAGTLAAYDCLYRGIELHNRMTDEDEPRARQMLLKAIELDPEFALAHAWLAVSVMGDWFEFGSREAFDKGLVLARRAVALDDDDGQCHAVLAYVCGYHRLFEQSAYHGQRALALSPHDLGTIAWQGMLLAYTGYPVDALDWLDSAFRLNPYPPEWYGPCKGMALYMAQRYEEAVSVIEGSSHACTLWTGIYHAASLVRMSRLEEAQAVVASCAVKRPHLSLLPYASHEPFKNPRDLDHLVDALRQTTSQQL